MIGQSFFLQSVISFIFGAEVFRETRTAALTYRDLYYIYFNGVAEFVRRIVTSETRRIPILGSNGH